MAASSRLRSGPGLVVVCCARDDADSLREALDSLTGEGHDVELVEGVDTDPKTLGEVIDRLQGEGLYVLCRSPRLGRERVEELREILLSRQIPFARTLTVAVGGRGALADRIRSGLRRASARGGGGITRTKSTRPTTSRPAAPTPTPPEKSQPLETLGPAEDDEPTLVGKRDDVPGLDSLSASIPTPSPTPTPTTPGGPAPSPAPLAPAPAIPDPAPFDGSGPTLPFENSPPLPASTPEPAEAEPALDPDAPLDDPLDDPLDAPLDEDLVAEAQLDAETEWPDGPTNVTEDPSASNSAAEMSMSDLDLSDLDNSVAKAAPTSGGTPPPLITGNTVVGPAPVMITGDTVVGKRLSDLVPVPGGSPWPAKTGSSGPLGDAEPTTEPFPRIEPRTKAPPPLPPTPGSPPPSARAPAPSPGPLSAPPSTPPAAPAAPLHSPGPGPAMAPSLDEPVGPPSRTLPLVLGGVALLLLALVITLAVWPGEDESEPVATKESEAEQAAKLEAAKKAKERAEQEAAERKANEPPPPPPEYAVVNALEARRVRALDVLLIATDTSKPGDFPTASSYCQQLDIDGLQGWRLPQVGELSSLSNANMIGRRGYFWSATAADTFGDNHLAWNVRRGYAQPHEKDAVAVCVRGGAAGS